MELTDSQLRDLREGLRHRERYYALYGGKYPPGDDERELDLALRWFEEWWKKRADDAHLRVHKARRDDRTADLIATTADADGPQSAAGTPLERR